MAKLTQKLIEKLTRPETGQRIIYDGEIPGFGVRITSNGVTSFILNYYNKARVKRRYTIGRWPEWSADAARDEALELRKGIKKDGQDPLSNPIKGDRTIAELAKEYLNRHALKNKRPSSVRNDRQMLQSIILPRLGHLNAEDDLDTLQREIDALHYSLKATKYRANRVLALLSKMFSLAMDWRWRSDNPTKGIVRYPEDRREVWLQKEQLQSLKKALDSYSHQDSANVLRLLICTGARFGEVINAKWDEFDLQRGRWTKPSHHTKEKKIEHVPLNPSALKILKRMARTRARKNESPYLFPGQDHATAEKNEKKEKQFQARRTVWRTWVQVSRVAGLAEPIEVQGKRKKVIRWKPICRLHDLRHTFASHLVSAGESLPTIGKLLGHCRTETTSRYAHVSDEAATRATNRFTEVIGSI